VGEDPRDERAAKHGVAASRATIWPPMLQPADNPDIKTIVKDPVKHFKTSQNVAADPRSLAARGSFQPLVL
jgi:hypothetical protein